MDTPSEIIELNKGAFKIVCGNIMSIRTYATYHDAKRDSDIDQEAWLNAASVRIALITSPIEWELIT